MFPGLKQCKGYDPQNHRKYVTRASELYTPLRKALCAGAQVGPTINLKALLLELATHLPYTPTDPQALRVYHPLLPVEKEPLSDSDDSDATT